MCAKNHVSIFTSFLDIRQNVEWPRFFGPPCSATEADPDMDRQGGRHPPPLTKSRGWSWLPETVLTRIRGRATCMLGLRQPRLRTGSHAHHGMPPPLANPGSSAITAKFRLLIQSVK